MRLYILVFSFFIVFSPSAGFAFSLHDLKTGTSEVLQKGLDFFTPDEKDATGKQRDLWNKALAKMEEGLAYLDSGKGKDEKEWYRIGRDPKFKQIVKDVFTILSVSDAKEKIDLASEYKKRIVERGKKIAAYEKAKIGAPATPEGMVDSALQKVNLFDTKDTLDEKIAAAKREIREYEAAIAALKEQMYQESKQSNPKIAREQIEALFICVDGEDLATLLGMAENIRHIQENLHGLIAKDKNNIELIKSYAGLYMMLNEAYAYAYELGINKIHESYQPKLDAIISSARKDEKDARALLQKSTAKDQRILQANIRSNLLTITVGEKYKTYLEHQKAYLVSSKKEVDHVVAVATNTYNTIKNSNDLLLLIKESEQDLDSIYSFKIPEFSIFHDEALRNEFEKITMQLQI